MKRLTLTSALALMLAGPALAATTAVSTTDLNLRANPGVDAEIVGVIASGDSVDVEGCIAEQDWCKVSYNGTEGWAYGAYLNSGTEADAMILSPTPERAEVVEVIKSDNDGQGAVAGGAMGASAVALAAGGPLAIVGGAIAGAIAGELVTPDEEVVTYVRNNPVEPVYLNGEVVVGATVPEGVTLYPVPDSKYQYVTVNGLPVVVDQDMKIVTIVR